MREHLAIAREQFNTLLCGAEAWGDPLGVLFMRWVDNGDEPAGRRAVYVLSTRLTADIRLFLQANRIARTVLRYARDTRCGVCNGRGQLINQHGVYTVCKACRAGMVTKDKPSQWARPHELGLTRLQTAVGHTINRARRELELENNS